MGQYAEIHELKHTAGFLQAAKRGHQLQMVMLSHADEDNRVLTDVSFHPLVAEAFHLLFTERDTHPDQVARWMRETNIRSENRLQVVRVDNLLEGQQLSELLVRVCCAFPPAYGRGAIVDAYLVRGTLFVRGPEHQMLHVPVTSIRALREMSPVVLRNFRVDPDGSFIHWPDVDVHLGWNQFLQAVDPAEFRKANQKSDDFNRRYGAAIRKTREDAGITQAGVHGLTDRQLRRIEQGECRATANALRHLATAHGLGLNEYMDKLSVATA